MSGACAAPKVMSPSQAPALPGSASLPVEFAGSDVDLEHAALLNVRTAEHALPRLRD